MALKVLNNEMVRTDKKNMLPRSYSSAASHASRPHHGYHLVDPSPWPA